MHDDLSALPKSAKKNPAKIGSHIYASPMVNRLGNSNESPINVLNVIYFVCLYFFRHL